MHDLGQATDRLSQRYRADHPAAQPILASTIDAAAYLTTRMPATYAAARQVFDRLLAGQPDLAPRTLLDLGAGTGACTWAAADAFGSLESSTLVDDSSAALAVAERLLDGHPLRTTYANERLGRAGHSAAPGHFDVAVCGFLLGELSNTARDTVVANLAQAAPVVAIIEPGTPAGYRRILAARTALIEAGLRIVAPCPHEGPCPLESTPDWCHFAVRLTRTVRHRQIKGGERGYEDEKYSYLIAASDLPLRRSGRILRHPQVRTGHVRMTVCAPDDGIATVTVGKRHRADYRAARRAGWGDSWPPPSKPLAGTGRDADVN